MVASNSFSMEGVVLKTAVCQKLFVTLSLVRIASIEAETNRKILNGKFRTSAKREIVRQSEACLLANQKNAKGFQYLVGQFNTNFSPFKQVKSVNELFLSAKIKVEYLM